LITAEASILISGISNTHGTAFKTLATETNRIKVKAGDLSLTEAGTEAGPKGVPDDPDDPNVPGDLVDPDVPGDPDVRDDREGKKSCGRKVINPAADQANVNYQAGTPKHFFISFKSYLYVFISPFLSLSSLCSF
jgi:hypothetical protein